MNTTMITKTWHVWLAALFALAISHAGQAQAPTAINDAVFAFNSLSGVGDHRDTVRQRWLKSDGSFVDITCRVFRSGVDLGYAPPLSGRYSYTKETGNTGRITFSSPTGSSSGSYELTFSDPSAGNLVDADGGPGFGVGKFTLRPSQFNKGPINISTRTFLSKAGSTIAGFVVAGADRRFVLIRAVGAGLSNFGVTATASGMGLAAHDSAGLIARAEDWTIDPGTLSIFQNLFTLAGAFPLAPGGGDACLLLELAPGAYTAEMMAGGDGNALVEVYFLP